MYVPAILGAILVSTLPFSNKVGLLFSYWISSELSCDAPTVLSSDNNPLVFAIAPFTLFLGWVASLTAGHTKRESMLPLALSRSLIDRLQVSPQMPSYSVLMRSEMPWVSLCGSHSTSRGKSPFSCPADRADHVTGTISRGVSSLPPILLLQSPSSCCATSTHVRTKGVTSNLGMTRTTLFTSRPSLGKRSRLTRQVYHAHPIRAMLTIVRRLSSI